MHRSSLHKKNKRSILQILQKSKRLFMIISAPLCSSESTRVKRRRRRRKNHVPYFEDYINLNHAKPFKYWIAGPLAQLSPPRKTILVKHQNDSKRKCT